MSATSAKIVLIGAGSAVFTQGLVADLILSGQSWEIALVDIDPKALETVLGLAKRMVDARGASIRVTAETDRRKVLPGASFVVSTIGVGGRRAWEQDVFIPREFGIYQPVGDTIMPGGISRALRQIPALVKIARDTLELAPAARFFNYANPMAAVCMALHRATEIDVVGLCHGVPNSERQIASILGVEQERCSFTAVGMNHLTFFTEILVDGEDALPRLREHFLNGEPNPGELFRRQLFLETGVYSALHDRHLTEFFPQFYANGDHPGGKLGVDLFSFEGTIAEGDAEYAAMSAQASGEHPLDLAVFDHQVGEHEQLVEIIGALEGGTPRRYSMNLPNEGQVGNLPRDLPLECPAEVSSSGIRAIEVGRVPDFVASAVTQRLSVVELAVEAALNLDRRLFLEAIIADGSAGTLDAAVTLAERLWRANEPYLETVG